MTNAYDHYPELTPRFDPLGIHPHEIPTEGIFDSPGVNVFVNAKWASHITGMIERLIYLDAWEGTEAEKYAAIDKIVKIISEFDKAENQGDKLEMQKYSPFEIHFHQNSKVLHGNPISALATATQEFGWSWRQSAPAINDEFYFKVLLPSEQIDLDICHIKQSGGGIVTISLDDDAGTAWNVDMYNATTQVNIHTILPFQATSAGLHTFNGKVASKNASSSSYVANITNFCVRPHYD